MSAPEKKSYKHTLNLPETSLPIRASLATREPELLAHWQEQGVEEQFFVKNSKPFVLHDGPPYANGNIHIGHALNKVLKDIVVRSARMAGKAVSYIPGWDCHGLPIELKVAGQNPEGFADEVAFKKACRTYADSWKQAQEKDFKRLAVFAEWDKRYMTMDPSYEADIVRSFATFVEKGHVERKGKTVPWCFSCETVLANAEIEYADRKDPSCFILFGVEESVAKHFSHTGSLSFLVWTTTPWTIPLNRAVVLHPDAQYSIVQVSKEQAVVVGADLVAKHSELFGPDAQVVATVPSSTFIGSAATHPLIDSFTTPVLGDVMVSTDEGTACLHSAPGCGPEDYMFGVKNGLEIFSPLSSKGTYTKGIVPECLEGTAITDGQWWVLKQLAERGTLFHKANIKHSYPHCWRCQNGLMFRATDQWFCNLAQNNLVQKAQEALGNVSFIPGWGKTRLDAFLGNRTEWCISRQRRWGVPIIALYQKSTGKHFTNAPFIRAIADGIAKEGIEYWDRVTIAELRSAGVLPSDLAGVVDDDIRKETDTLDVWFDSGVSHTAAVKAAGVELPVDVYLEGSDQHRGWFQSSVLSSMIMNSHPPMKDIITHGFVVDEKGLKMSKSRGNVVDPHEVIKKHGADVLRLWVASVDYERDVALSMPMLDQVSEMYRKIRNTCRFLLANLYDFSPEQDCVPLDKLTVLDAHALNEAIALHKQVRSWYEKYQYPMIVQAIVRYCTVSLSAEYLDMTKDRLYVETQNGIRRRSAQTAQYHILELLLQMLAPIVPFMAEDVFLNLPYKSKQSSVHLNHFSAPIVEEKGADHWSVLHEIRDAILKSIERLREQGVVKQSLEAAVHITCQTGGSWHQALESVSKNSAEQQAFLKEWCIVSAISVTLEDENTVITAHAPGEKCPRCWHWHENAGELCERCEAVVTKQ